ncbi:MAG: DUF433 domain-containing protein, partial [Verrucomicrobia bacterium]|nr:DUF433 domain-containing protein [Verrucomicrobiota bacterium]
RQIETQISTTDHQIDRLVYDLYELAEEEIAIVEGRPAPVAPVDNSKDSAILNGNIVVMPGIEKTPRVSGGKACIGFTRIPVWAVAQLRRLGLEDARILECYPGLAQSDLDAAWKYVAQHEQEIDISIRENEEA